MKRSNPFRLAVAALIGFGAVSCTSLPFLVPNPPGGQKKEAAAVPSATDKETAKQPALTEKPDIPARGMQTPAVLSDQRAAPENPGAPESVDFALALSDSQAANESSAAALPEPLQKGPVISSPAHPAEQALQDSLKVIPVPQSKIRVALRRAIAKITLYSMDTMEINSASLPKSPWFRGRITITAKGNGAIAVEAGTGAAREVALPCTLAARDGSSLIDLGQENYRGSVIITGDERLSVINYIGIEDYLRGVLPLEMGTRGNDAKAALEAQAIAARTYAYKRMSGRAAEAFDVVATVADQVYGGADVETGEADRAVRSTQDLVLAWHAALADVYFHSTCGGSTADISEAWDRAPCEYLRSVSDSAPAGTAYCSSSKYFTWEERWSADHLSKIVRSTTAKTVPGEDFRGVLEEITVYSRFPCGRVKVCALKGSDGSAVCGGDKIRFVLRPKSATGQILRSANFTVEETGTGEFMLRGRGYGHGVGMCQMGAIGRARAGQSYRQILAAYFRNTEIRRAVVGGETR